MWYFGILKSFLNLNKEAAKAWHADNAIQLGAALAFYTTLSIAPLLLVTISIFGLVFGEKLITSELLVQVEQLTSVQIANFLKEVLTNDAQTSTGVLASFFGIVSLIIAAAGVFVQLQQSLDDIWGATKTNRKFIVSFILGRLKSFALVFSIGFLLLVSFIMSAVLTTISNFTLERFPVFLPLLSFFNSVFSLIVISFLFSAIFKIIPAIKLKWKDVILGGFVTSLLFALGKAAISYYLGYTAVASLYGAAGSLVIFLIWIYYASQILYYGAEFTKVYATKYGSLVDPQKVQDV
ncbi:MAG: YihY/virulence factor BrkB family protein [Bdellovibrionales bacterium]|nr:YihY/virulence factor BrkB family protein [Bdellovibrionales bacterium]